MVLGGHWGWLSWLGRSVCLRVSYYFALRVTLFQLAPGGARFIPHPFNNLHPRSRTAPMLRIIAALRADSFSMIFPYVKSIWNYFALC